MSSSDAVCDCFGGNYPANGSCRHQARIVRTVGVPQARWLHGDAEDELLKLAIAAGAQFGDVVQGTAYPDANGVFRIESSSVRIT